MASVLLALGIAYMPDQKTATESLGSIICRSSILTSHMISRKVCVSVGNASTLHILSYTIPCPPVTLFFPSL